MSKETAFIGAGTAIGNYWTRRRFFDYLINRENFTICYGKNFQMIILMDAAVSLGAEQVKATVEQDTRDMNYLIDHLHEIKSELTVFVTTCDMLAQDADENTPPLTESDDPYTNNRIRLYHAVNHNFGRVLNVHIPSLAIADANFSPLLHACDNPPKGKGVLPFNPEQKHQFYPPERIIGDVERCIPMGISSIIPAAPPLSTREVIEALAPQLLPRLSKKAEGSTEDSERSSIHSLHWLDPQDGYFVTKEDQIELLQFYIGEFKI